MSFLDFIPGIGTALDVAGGVVTNIANAKQAQKNRDFQERMSSTAHQREVEDYKKAGLNPALAYGRSGESSPSGSTATLENPSKGLGSTAAAAVNARNQSIATKNQTNLTQAQIAATNAQAAKTQAETQEQNILNAVAQARADLELDKLRSGNKLTSEQATAQEQENIKFRNTYVTQLQQVQADLNNTVQNTATAKASEMLMDITSKLKNADLPAAEAAAKAAKTWVGQNMAPWLKPFLDILDRFLRIGNIADRFIPSAPAAGPKAEGYLSNSDRQ